MCGEARDGGDEGTASFFEGEEFLVVGADRAVCGVAAMDLDVFEEGLDACGEGVGRGGRGTPMAMGGGVEFRGEFAIGRIEVFVAVIVEGGVVDIGKGEGF